MIIKTDAIVLKSFDFRETSRIVTFYSRDHGKIKGILKGIRKDPKKFRSHVDRFSVNEILLYHSFRSEIHLVSHCDLKEDFFALRQEYKRNVAAHYILELLDRIMPIEQPNMNVYQLVLDYLNTLKTQADSQEIDKLVHIFQIKILLHSGFRPHLDACVRCQKKIGGKVRFSLQSGGLLCPECPTMETAFTLISQGAVASIVYIEQNNWEKCLLLGLTKDIRQELKYTLNNFLVYHLDQRVRSTKLLHEITQ